MSNSTPFHGTILSQVFEEYAPVISHHQSNCLQVTAVTVRKQSGHNMQTAYTNWSEVS